MRKTLVAHKKQNRKMKNKQQKISYCLLERRPKPKTKTSTIAGETTTTARDDVNQQEHSEQANEWTNDERRKKKVNGNTKTKRMNEERKPCGKKFVFRSMISAFSHLNYLNINNLFSSIIPLFDSQAMSHNFFILNSIPFKTPRQFVFYPIFALS